MTTTSSLPHTSAPVDAVTDDAMERAAELARAAGRLGNVPVGAIVLSPEGEVIGEGANQRHVLGDPTAHAELLAIRQAAKRLGSWRLEGATLVVTLEPCAMCAGAIVQARLARVVVGALEPGRDGDGSGSARPSDARSKAIARTLLETAGVEVITGVREASCTKLLNTFFERLRSENRSGGGP